MTSKAKFIKEISLTDNDGNEVTIEVYQHENGGVFGIDSSFLEESCDDDTYPIIPNPFGSNLEIDDTVMLTEQVNGKKN